MSANRDMLRYEEKLYREVKATHKWTNRHGTKNGMNKVVRSGQIKDVEVPLPTCGTASVAICVMGHPLDADGCATPTLAMIMALPSPCALTLAVTAGRSRPCCRAASKRVIETGASRRTRQS